MLNYILAVVIASFFYIFLPGLGALIVRRRWMTFRRRLVEVSAYSNADYSLSIDAGQGVLGRFRFFGILQAINPREEIWLEGEQLSLSALMDKSRIYLVPEAAGQDQLDVVSWNRMYSLAEGTRIFIAGWLRKSGGKIEFFSTRDEPLTVLLYEGSPNTLLDRGLTGGRQTNEFWNFITPWSLACGVIVLLSFAFFHLHNNPISSEGFFYLMSSLLPFLAVLPPGILGLFAFRHFWKKARDYKRKKELYALPGRFFSVSSSVVGVYEDVEIRPGVYYALEKSGEGYVFGLRAKNREVVEPNDPFCSKTFFPEDPFQMARKSKSVARMNEILSGLSFVFGLLINLLLYARIIRFML